MVHGHLQKLPALFSQAQKRLSPLARVVRGPKEGDRTHPHKRVDHDGNDGAVAKGDDVRVADAVQKRARVLGKQHRRLAPTHHMPRPPNRRKRIEGQGTARHQPVRQHPQRRKMLFDGRRRRGLAQYLYIGTSQHRLHIPKPTPVRRTTQQTASKPAHKPAACLRSADAPQRIPKTASSSSAPPL